MKGLPILYILLDSIGIFDLYSLLYKHVIADIFIVSTILFRLDNLKGTFILDVEGMLCICCGIFVCDLLQKKVAHICIIMSVH